MKARAHNRDLEHRVFDEEAARRFLAENFTSREVGAFNACAVPAMQSDYFRYCAVYALGGVYCDADLVVSRSLRPLLDEAGEIVATQREGLWRNDVFACRISNHPFLRLAIDIATLGVERRYSENIPAVTGPVVFSTLVALWKLGSVGEFTRRMTEQAAVYSADKQAERRKQLEIVRDAVGDHGRVANAFEGVRLSPPRRLKGIVAKCRPAPRYKRSVDHYGNWEGSIYR